MLAVKDAPKPLQITHSSWVNSVAFSPDGSSIVTGGDDGIIQQWSVEDGRRVGTAMKADDSVLVVAISSDGKWIVSGGLDCKVTVWDARSQQRVVESSPVNKKWVSAIDVSPGSTRFASASGDCTATIWSLTKCQRLVGPLEHSNRVECIAFSPDGDHLATVGAFDCLRIWNSRTGETLIEVQGFFPESLVWWHDDRIFASTWSGHRWLDALSGATLLEFPPDSSDSAEKTHLAVSRNRDLLAGLNKHSICVWDNVIHAWSATSLEIGYNACTIAVSSDGRHMVAGGGNKVSIWNVSDILHAKHCTHNQPKNGLFMHLNGVIQDLWMRNKLEEAREFISRDITLNSKSHDAFANRALLQARLRRWNEALVDADMSIEMQPSVIGYIAKSVALCGLEMYEDSMQAFDLAFSHCRPEHVNSLLLMKSVVIFLCGLHPHAISRATDMIKREPGQASHCIVQAWMFVLLAKSAIEKQDYDYAIRLLTSQDPGRGGEHPSELLTISLITGWKFSSLRFKITENMCEALFAAGRMKDAVNTLTASVRDLGQETQDGDMEWVAGFKKRCFEALQQLGELAMDSSSHSDAAEYFSSALMLDPSSVILFTKRSEALAVMGDWEGALRDAESIVALDPSSPWGDERRHAALHGAGRYEEAIEAINAMLLKLDQSPDSQIRELRSHYVYPSQAAAAVQSCARQIQSDLPLILINLVDGHLYDQQERIRAFEADPKFKELVSAMYVGLDNDRIKRVVREYFCYVTFSHTWDGNEPQFHDVMHRSAHDLAKSPGVHKLLMFCVVARGAGFTFAWSDTCCINKVDVAALQESLASMFQWYHNSSLTIVHLKGVQCDSELGALKASLWNTRAWTLQEFFASRTIRFYTEDWKPYLTDDKVFNHKKSVLIMREMALATGVDAQDLLVLNPGSEHVRQKLRLASTRFATKQEDIAYSLFGIFDVSIPVTYGEGQRRALGRLLQEVITRSGDITVLAWTGSPSDYNSCLPAEISVYRQPITPLIPSPIEDDKMDSLVAELESSSTSPDSAVELYDRLIFLPSPRLVSRRLSLSCIVFLLRTFSGPFPSDDPSLRVYRATASALGDVEIRTVDDLSDTNNLVLVHPWIQSLFDPVLPHEDMIDDDAKSLALHPSAASPRAHAHAHAHAHSHALQLPSPLDKTTRALRLFARLRQPFGALLLVPQSSKEYKRVATDNPIVVQIRTLDIL